MARVKLELPENYHFQTQVSIRIDDMNYGNHMGNDRFLAIMHEARRQFLESLDGTELSFFGKSLIMADSVISYRKEVKAGDLINIQCAINDITKYGFDIVYYLTNNKTGDDVAHAKTGMTFYSYEENKIQKAPEEFLKKFN